MDDSEKGVELRDVKRREAENLTSDFQEEPMGQFSFKSETFDSMVGRKNSPSFKERNKWKIVAGVVLVVAVGLLVAVIVLAVTNGSSNDNSQSGQQQSTPEPSTRPPERATSGIPDSRATTASAGSELTKPTIEPGIVLPSKDMLLTTADVTTASSSKELFTTAKVIIAPASTKPLIDHSGLQSAVTTSSSSKKLSSSIDVSTVASSSSESPSVAKSIISIANGSPTGHLQPTVVIPSTKAPASPAELASDGNVTNVTASPQSFTVMKSQMTERRTVLMEIQTESDGDLDMAVYGRKDFPPTHTRYDFTKPLDTNNRRKRGVSKLFQVSEILDAGQWYLALFNEGQNTVQAAVRLTTSTPPLPCPKDCSGNGVCFNGTCICLPPWTQDDCSEFGCQVSGCNNHGKCQNGLCVCDQGWKGADCSIVDCIPPDCSRHGQCVNGICECDGGWKGDSCEKEKKTCPNDCSNKGTCNDDTGSCACDAMFTGVDCSIALCTDNCSGNGHCVNGSCVCDPAWTGLICNTLVCSLGCNINGICNNGTCVCNKGWKGASCQIDACPNNCHQNGSCTKNDEGVWHCVCLPGFRGISCRIGIESICDDGIDNDHDMLIDCDDPDCCNLTVCAKDEACMTALDPTQLVANETFNTTVSFYETIQFLFDSGLQTGVDLTLIDSNRVGVVKGTVTTRDTSNLAGVTVAILNQPGYGHTLTRADGSYDIAVNGGGSITLTFNKKNFIGSQRSVSVPVNDYVRADGVALIPLDSEPTEVDLSEGDDVKVASGSRVEDDSGSRQGRLMFPPNTQAMVLSTNGSENTTVERPVIRVTEYTVGENGRDAMPAELPPYTGYTYAVEMSLDQASVNGSTEVVFNQTVAYYVENYLGFPVGSAVPVGYYNRTLGEWVASENGRVVLVLNVTTTADGKKLAVLDVNGDGKPATLDELDALGVIEKELLQVGSLYSANQSLWRVPIRHFTPWDCNWPYGPPPDGCTPYQCNPNEPIGNPSPNDDPNDPCKSKGSIIIPQTRSLGEQMSIAGSPLTLYYFSDRVLGYKPVIDIPLTAASIPESLKKVHLRVEIRGRTFEETFEPSVNLKYQFSWDRKDSDGRTVSGQVTAFISVGYEYGLVYYPVSSDFRSSFNRLSQASISRPVRRQSSTAVFWEKRSTVVGNTFGPVETAGLGGWSINAHHSYDPVAGVLHEGGGKRTKFRDKSRVIETLAGNGVKRPVNCPQCSSSLPDSSPLLAPVCLAVSLDGSVFVGDYQLIRRVYPDGNMTTVFDFSSLPPDFAYYIAISPVDGDLFISYGKTRRIYRIQASLLTADKSPVKLDDIGQIPGATVFAGTGERCAGWDENCGDDGAAVEARLSSPKGIGVGFRSDVYFADGKVIRQIGVDGVISTFAGSRLPRGCSPPGCTQEGIGNHDVVLDRAYFNWPTDVVVRQDDESVYFIDGRYVFHVTREGRIRLVAGSAPHVPPSVATDDQTEGSDQFSPRPATSVEFQPLQGLAVWRDGSIYFGETNGMRVNRIRLLDQSGFVGLVTGVDSSCDCRYCSCFSGDGQATALAKLFFPSAVSLSPDGGRLYIADQGNVRVRTARITLPKISPDGHYVIPSDDGKIAYLFDFTGRHVSTVLSSTSKVIQTFDYEDFDTPQGQRGLLTAIRDGYNNSLVIQRNQDGRAVSLQSSYGFQTKLEINNDGYLSRFTDPAGATVQFTYKDSEGLLASTTDPRSMVHTYRYDEYGRLARDQQPNGGTTFVSAVNTGKGKRVVVETATGKGYSVDVETTGSETRQIVTESTGAKTVSIDLGDGSQLVSYEDGTKSIVETTSHPIWGQQLPVVSKITAKLPSGLSREMLSKHRADLAEKNEPLSVTQFGYTLTVGESDMIDVEYLRSTKTRTVKYLQSNVETKSIFNNFDQEVESITTASGLFPTYTKYDDKGLTTLLSQGNATQEFIYDVNARLIKEMEEGETGATFTYKPGSTRPNTMTLASNKTYTFTYDPFDELETITMPSGSVHRLITTIKVGKTTEAYAAPGQNESYVGEYDTDGDLVLERYPSGKRRIQQQMDSGGRILRSSFDDFVVDYQYDDKTDRVSKIFRHKKGLLGSPSIVVASDEVDDIDVLLPDVLPGTATNAFQYDGSFVTQQTTDFASNGGDDLSASFVYQYDSVIRLSSRKLTLDDGTSSTVTYQYDKANRVVKFGDFNVDYSQSGEQSLSDSRLQYKTKFTGNGRIKERTMTVNGKTVYIMKLLYGKRLRILSKSLSFGSQTTDYQYEYDIDGQLTKVKTGGVIKETYNFDENGNRVLWTNGPTFRAASYNSKDQMNGFSGAFYTVDEDGFLTRKRGLSYSYSSQGELTSVEYLSTGLTISSYIYDGLNRRVTKTTAVTREVTKYLYGDLSNPQRITDVVTSTGVTHLHYDFTGHLFAFDRGSDRFYVASDQIGTPWAVVDSSGAIVKLLSYTSYGVVLTDSDASFDAVLGFAGGLHDRDSGLVHFMYRDYDPEIGRWTARDPSLYTSLQPNLYQYVFNDPVNFLDPLGLWCIGGSWYFIIGGGAEFCYKNGRASLCAEKGYGIGWSVSADARKEASRSKLSVFAEGGVSKNWLYGGVGAQGGVEYELTKPPPCEDRFSWSVAGAASLTVPALKGVGVGVQGSYGSSGGKLSVVGGASGGGKALPGRVGFGAQAKVGIRGCIGSR
eukprot:m.45749 g.45749  ORF g.45749 m.45749 type:complete len:2670 (+) comp33632_c0_seq3:67-8076(+)